MQKAEGRRQKRGAARTCALLFCILHSAFCIRAEGAPRQRAIRGDSPAAWLRAHAIPLASIEPSADESDLAPLLPLLKDAHVIALSDATHGTHEFFSVKQRLIPFLVKHANVRTIILEAPYGEMEAVNDYVKTGAGDPAPMLHIDDYFFWNAEEVLDTIRWVRAWNAAGNPPVEFIGADAYHPRTSIARVLSMLDGDARADAAHAYDCVANLTIATAQWYRDSCHASVMSVRSMLESRHASFELLHGARIVEQGEESLNRDSAMAENIERLADRPGSGNYVVWGHNEHFMRTPSTLNDPNGTKTSGAHLAERYGNAYVAIGTIAWKGMYNASQYVNGEWVVGQYPMTDPAPDDYATTFATASMPRMIVPLRGALPSWLALPHPIRVGGSNVESRVHTTVTLTEELAKTFDAMIYVETSTATRLRP